MILGVTVPAPSLETSSELFFDTYFDGGLLYFRDIISSFDLFDEIIITFGYASFVVENYFDPPFEYPSPVPLNVPSSGVAASVMMPPVLNCSLSTACNAPFLFTGIFC